MNTANVCKEILEKGNSSPIYPQLSLDKSAFLFDSLEIGKTKYLELRRTLLSEDLKLPGYNSVAKHQAQINLLDEVRIIHREFPCGVGISYTRLLTHTVERIVSNLSPDNLVYPLKVRVSDGLDGSGCHRVYQQAISNPDLSTKTFILFGFKVNSIINAKDHILWKPHHPNSPFCTRPVALLALPENEESVKFLMDSLRNNETSTIEESGLCLHNGNAEVKIIRSHFDTKMAKILSGAGGANCRNVYCNCGAIQKWSPTSPIILGAKKFITSLIEEKLSISIDTPSVQGGTTTTGNVVRRCFTRSDDTVQDFLYWVLTVIPQETHQVVTTIFNNLSAILRLYNSNRKVDTEGLDNVCRETYESILTNFSWAHVTPTLHKLLAHAPQIIADHNDGFGLEDLSEEGLESCNKLVRRYRERLSRKFSFEDNVKDVFVRLIFQSDPILASFRNITKNDSEPDLTELKSCQDILVKSLIINTL
ncbi:Dna-mediated transposase [Oopsacas minuta]|uniref:Dna-mediated transposase n=1 Tax=Oopsacas minuta TaxID=111878 RepID=A0AAV7JQR9_9METZ|nr:Dna-mediated transposase [Oopsacas minuta]